jgi:DNA-binding MarR family transcriptional regulator
VASPLPLPTLLSQALVAFTIEFDNEFEHRLPHRTKDRLVRGGGPWLVSRAMWANFMRFVPADGMPLRELAVQARLTNLAGLERWGYVRVEPDPDDRRQRPPRGAWVVRPTTRGRVAQEVWRPLGAEIEERWAERFGRAAIDRLHSSLDAILAQADVVLPAYLPVLGYGLWTRLPATPRSAATARPVADDADAHDLSVPLARVLLLYALDAEPRAKLSLAIGLNVLRVLDETGVLVRDLPQLTGVSKESIAVATGFMAKRGLVAIEPHPGAERTNLVRLTPGGAQILERFAQALDAVDEGWRARFGTDRLNALWTSLERLVVGAGGGRSPLWQGLEPYPDGWRAGVRRPETLPHYPMVLHRGGFPDGA